MRCYVIEGFYYGLLRDQTKPSMVKRAASFLGLAKTPPTVSKVSTLHTVD
jgi:hypothetical protein